MLSQGRCSFTAPPFLRTFCFITLGSLTLPLIPREKDDWLAVPIEELLLPCGPPPSFGSTGNSGRIHKARGFWIDLEG